MQKKKLIIVGCGPKALNILAKAEALKHFGWEVPEIIVLEKGSVGSNWSGSNGYTDGKGILGISPLKTFNYPSNSIFGEDVAKYMDKFSFKNSFPFDNGYEKWVDGGMNWITHEQFAQYLWWISYHFEKNIYENSIVTKVTHKDNIWNVEYETHGKTYRLVSDGLVFTGPGEVDNPFNIKPNGVNVFDAKNWWNEKEKFHNLHGSVALIGGGISAGSIFETILADKRSYFRIDWYTRRGLFTRSENFANNQRFSHPELWQQIPIETRKNFISSTDRGSIDSTTHKAMSDCGDYLQEIICDISSVEEADGKIRILFKDGLGQKARLYDKIVLCTGFNNTDFLKLTNTDTQSHLSYGLENSIEPDLSVKDFIPKLHLPMLSAINVGIGCATLGSPSTMSDRLLSSWVTKDPKLEVNDKVHVVSGSSKGDSLIAARNLLIDEVVVAGYPTSFLNQRTKNSVQISIDLHIEPSYLFVKANHSCNPNCGVELNKFGGYSLRSLRRIERGEEITWDYAMTEWESIALENKKCQCGSSNCRGVIGGYKNLPDSIKDKYRELECIAPYLKLYL